MADVKNQGGVGGARYTGFVKEVSAAKAEGSLSPVEERRLKDAFKTLTSEEKQAALELVRNSGFDAVAQRLGNDQPAKTGAALPHPGPLPSTGEAVRQSANPSLPAHMDRIAVSKEARAEADAMKRSVKQGNYAEALEHAKRAQAADSANGALNAVVEQIGVGAEMQKAGFPAQMPPTGAQMERCFQGFNPRATPPGDPSKAPDALARYAHAFHVHPGNVKDAKDNPRGSGINYQTHALEQETDKGGTIPRAPSSWEDVAPRSPSTGQRPDVAGPHAGKTFNDCEGFAFMGKKLLGAAGYEGRIVSGLSKQEDKQTKAHAMAAMVGPEPDRRPVVISNEEVLVPKKPGAEESLESAFDRKDAPAAAATEVDLGRATSQRAATEELLNTAWRSGPHGGPPAGYFAADDGDQVNQAIREARSKSTGLPRGTYDFTLP